MHMIYDVAHNTAKLEQHQLNGKQRTLLVHQKGATHALGPGHPELPETYRQVEQHYRRQHGDRILFADRYSDRRPNLFSTAHGSGRTMSRRKMNC